MLRKSFPGAAALLFAVLSLAGCGRGDIGAAVYPADQCRRVALKDAQTGAVLRGAEDLALDPVRGLLIVSAYDRRAVEKAARRNGAEPPEGGIYAVSLPALFDPSNAALEAASLIDPETVAGGLRPHGIHYDAARGELAFVNRAYRRSGGKWRMTPALERARLDGGAIEAPAAGALSCAANSVLATEQKIYTSFDHGRCGWRGGLEAVFNLKRSGLALDGVGPVYARAGFANGLARTGEGEIVMAATRESALLFFSETPGGVEETARIGIPGGPDNLSLSHDGGVVAAAHPSLMRLALNRKLGVGRAPSRIVKVEHDTRATRLLFDDPSGRLFSAATVAIETKEGLVAGSVTDEGLLVCRNREKGP